MTSRAAIMAALEAALRAIPGTTVERDADIPQQVPAGGLIVLREGETEPVDLVLGGPQPIYTNRYTAEVEIYVSAASGREAALEALIGAVAAMILANRGLAGAQWLDCASPQYADQAALGGVPIKAVLLPVTAEYDTTSPTG